MRELPRPFESERTCVKLGSSGNANVRIRRSLSDAIVISCPRPRKSSELPCATPNYVDHHCMSWWAGGASLRRATTLGTRGGDGREIRHRRFDESRRTLTEDAQDVVGDRDECGRRTIRLSTGAAIEVTDPDIVASIDGARVRRRVGEIDHVGVGRTVPGGATEGAVAS